MIEYGSPCGRSWLDLVIARGLVPSAGGVQADVIIGCFGLMHADDPALGRQNAAFISDLGVQTHTA